MTISFDVRYYIISGGEIPKRGGTAYVKSIRPYESRKGVFLL